MSFDLVPSILDLRPAVPRAAPLDWLARAVPALARADAGHDIAPHRAQPPWFDALADAIDHALAVLQPDHRLAYANGPMRALLAGGMPLRIGDDGRLHAGLSEDEGVLCAAVREASCRGLRRMVQLGAQDAPRVVALVGMGDAPAESGRPCLLMVGREAASSRLTIESYARLRRLTPTEAEVAVQIADGLDPAAIAEHLGVRITTVRTHVRNVLAKVGVRTLRELVLRLSALPPVAPAVRGGR